jgi:SAM-dependent methyltransferase
MHYEKTLLRSCPVCQYGIGVVHHSFRFVLPVGFLLPDNYDLVSCDRCGFVFADTPARQDVYDCFYAELSKYEDKISSSGGSYTVWDKERFTLVTRHLAEFIPKHAVILDVGCANGGLLLELREAGYEEIIGLDPSKQCVANVSDQGIGARQGGIFSADLHSPFKDGFGCIILSHVLEHIRDLSQALEWLSKQLSSGGMVYVEVPDASRYPEFYKIPNYYFDCEHINHFDSISLVNLFSAAGFTLCDLQQRDIPVSDFDRYPVVAAIFRKLPASSCQGPLMSFEARTGVDAYLRLSSEDNVNEIVASLAEEGEELMVWGAGQYALRLLSSTRLAECRIVAFLDQDRKKQGMQLGGVPVLSPDSLLAHRGPVVVCSALFSAEICEKIRAMGFDNSIVVLKGGA